MLAAGSGERAAPFGRGDLRRNNPMTLFLRDPTLSFGNDVVDLREEADRSSHFLDRYVRRICTEREVSLVGSEPDMARALWRIWALKESAFKAVHRRDRSRAFRYRELEVQPGFESVVDHFSGSSFNAFCRASGDFVYGVAWSSQNADLFDEPFLVSWLDRVAVASDLSRAVREQVQRVLGRLEHEFPEEPIRRDSDEDGTLHPPVLELPRGRAPVSLSHHGRLVMTTMQLHPSAEPTIERGFGDCEKVISGRRIFILSV